MTRSQRWSLLSLGFYLIFIGGSAYYNLIFPVRVFHHMFITLVLGIWLYRRIRRDGLPRTPLNAPLYAAVVIWLVTAAASQDPRMAFEYTWFNLIHVALFFGIVDLLQRGRQRLIMETGFLLAALVVIMTGMEVASWYFGLGIIPGTEIGWIDVIGPGAWLPLESFTAQLALNISTLLAGFTAPIITVTIGWALTARRKDYRQTLWLLAAGLLVVLALTHSRGGLMSLGAGFGAFAAMRFVQRPSILRRVPLWVYGAVGLVAAFMLFAVIGLRETTTAGDTKRIDMYESAVEMVADYPITGVGPGLFGRAFREYRTASIARDKLASAHNLYLNTAAETGLAGIVFGIWLAGALVWAWKRAWDQQTTDARRIRVETSVAALLGVGVHSLVDAFTVTPVVLVILVITAYSITGHRTVLDERPAGQRLPALIGLLLVLGYGVLFIQSDRAQSAYYHSIRDSDLDAAQQAKRIDPHLNLYDLQIAYLLGQDPNRINEAIAAYEHALDLEPTWDAGWANLAVLLHRQGNTETAIDYLLRAHSIFPLSSYQLHAVRWMEESQSDDLQTIHNGYYNGARFSHLAEGELPIADFWTVTDLRVDALNAYVETMDPEARYRVLGKYDPALVPATAQEWWVTGEVALTIDGDPAAAEAAFSEAIALDRANGDYYVARARATLESDPDIAQRDLDIAEMLGTTYECLNCVRTAFARTDDKINALLEAAGPHRVVRQYFAAVLYGGRLADFDIPSELHWPVKSKVLWYVEKSATIMP